ncbi:PLP-dependent aspartate aminotransferase family protein [Actinoplanes sp. NPDC026619]|uniref:trans-sulfuration enzyme family protein n=1 Tax=Actinoplanes sp. NPDC026619 TaxID=3155798 RepID=UPI0033E11E33
MEQWGPSTTAVHAGVEPDPTTGALNQPIHMSSVYVQPEPGNFRYDYGRSMNPDFYPLEKALAALEGAQHATVVSSGVGAMSALLGLLDDNSRIVLPTDVYGGTYRLFQRIFAKIGVVVEQIDMTDAEVVDNALKDSTRTTILYAESPTNPLLLVYDLRELSTIAKRYGATTVLDSTFASPIFQNGLALGFDIVLHSCSKYMGGHSDIVAGALMTNDAEIKTQLDFTRTSMGLHLDPNTMFLLRRGLKTLPLRMERHQSNAMAVAEFLEGHRLVRRALYPGLKSHPQHHIAAQQMSGYSGMVSVEFDLDLPTVSKLVSNFRLFELAESLGGVESLVELPALMTHLKIPAEVRRAHGLADGLARFSVGIEDVEDLLQDLETGLSAI